MLNEVWNVDFWKRRLRDAQGVGILHWSVYLVNSTQWKNINRVHDDIFNKVISDDSRVLDAGCGYGRWSNRFTNYVGVDFSPDFIQKAKELFPDKEFILADLQKLPFKKDEFDWAFCVSIKDMIQEYDSVEKWDKIEKELKRVAKNVLLLEYTNPREYTIL